MNAAPMSPRLMIVLSSLFAAAASVQSPNRPELPRELPQATLARSAAALPQAKAPAADYGIDTNRVGVTGISSGAHLSLMIAGSPDSPVNAVAAIAPPTDLANWGKPNFVLTDDPQMAVFVPALGFDPKGPRADIES